MEKQLKVDPKGECLLCVDEMRGITGGSLTQGLIKLVIWGVGYFYNMGVQEGRRMKALL